MVNWNVWRPLVVSVLLVLGAGGCDPEEADAPPDMTQYFERFEKLERTSRSPSDGIYAGTYIVEGDLLLADYREFVAYYTSMYGDLGIRNPGTEFAARSDGLTINQLSGVNDVWPKEKAQDLTYCVSALFEKKYGRASYNTVVDAMEQATAEWSQAAAVKFRRVDGVDNDCDSKKLENDNKSILFAVEPDGCSGDALAFFPGDAVGLRRLCINWRSSNDLIKVTAEDRPNDSMTMKGILLHELGHILGFRHEHIRAGVPQWSNETDALENPINTEGYHWSPLTDYDHCSVMHYRNAAMDIHDQWCGDYKLTGLDKEAATSVYAKLPPPPPTQP